MGKLEEILNEDPTTSKAETRVNVLWGKPCLALELLSEITC